MTTQAQIDALKATLAQLQSQVGGLTADPIIVPPPPPGPTVDVVSRVVTRPRAIIMSAMLPSMQGHRLTVGFSDGGRYDRQQQAVELAGQAAQVGAWTVSPTRLGSMVTIRGFLETTVPQLTWGVDWTATVTLTPRVGSAITLPPVAVSGTQGEFWATFDKSQIPEGPYLVGVTGQPPGFGVLEYPMYVRHGATALPQTHMLVVTGSYTHANNGNKFAYAWVPAKFDPLIVPLPHRQYPPVNPRDMTDLAYTMLVPFTRADGYRPNVLPSGLMTTANLQNYGFASDFYQQSLPRWPILEGPRGRGNLICATSLRETKRPDSGKVLFTTPHAVGTVSDDGTIHIEAGYKHSDPPPYTNWNSSFQQRPPAPVTLVGDWSAIPVARQGFNELWDVAVDERTTALDNNAPPIGGEQPHVGDVVKYVTDTRKDRVCKITYDGKDRTKPAKVTEFAMIPGGKPWWCECVGNLLIVTWSGVNQVIAYDMDTGALVWSFPMTRPEGIRVMDGIAYIGSGATWTVHKLDLTTRALTKFCDVIHNNNSQFVNVAVSDGTFGPRGSVAYTTWSNDTYGVPPLIGPDGVRLKVGARNNPGYGEAKGMFMPDGLGYLSCVSIGNGRMTFATVQDGLHRLSAALPTDAVVPPEVAIGAAKAHDLSLQIVWGDCFFPQNGVPLPWGKYGPEVDAFMTNMGHTR